jgi:LCP family protein required for cell wall assembly
VSDSAGQHQIGLRHVVAALTLALPAILLIVGLLALPAPAPPAAPLVVATEVMLDAGVVSTDVAAVEETAPAPVAVVVDAVATPRPVTSVPTSRVTATPTNLWIGPQTFTFVALGVDQRDDREIPRTDTIMIGRVDLRTPKVNLISIPRDLLVDIPGYGKDRINAAYVYGEQYKEPGGGIGMLQRTIEKNFGITVDHFGLVDFQCFRTAVDSVGGVTVNVPRAILDPKYPTEDYGTKIVRFEPGLQLMDGERALEYARTRSADNDFQRIQRQQMIISAMRDQILQLRTFPSVPSLLTGCRNMRSDLGWRDYLSLATSLQTLNGNKIAFSAIDDNMVVDTVLSSGAAVLSPRWDRIRPLVAESFGTGAASTATRAGAAASPTPGTSVAGPMRDGVLPGDASLQTTPAPLPSRRT